MEHYYKNIKGWFNWPELYSRAVQQAPKRAVFVEIGCYLGRSTSYLAVEILNSRKAITLICCDLWEPSNKIGCTEEEFRANLQPAVKAGLHLVPWRGDSAEAAKQVKDGSVDFVWVDGGHRYPQAIADIRAWWPKLKDGGWMGGDDLIHIGVRPAVEEFFGPECLPGDREEHNWARFQSALVVTGKGADIRPNPGGWVWWTRSKSQDWTPKGLLG